MNGSQWASGKLQVFETMESEVRSYIRSFPTKFRRASGYRMWDTEGKEYVDFFSGAGALNYGHNPPEMKRLLIQYLQEDGISHSLDMATEAKERFLLRFGETILRPRGLDYKVMFPGPTGANSVESALKLARKATGRQTVMSFTNAFHGMTLGALAVTGNKFKRKGAGVPLHHTVTFPYDGYMGPSVNTLTYIENFLEDSGSGISLPAAVILETLQGEGGLQAASGPWLRGLANLCKRHGILMIVDDVQMGCGRTGTFFSFEPFGMEPDIVCLSKSIGGYGLPMALTLLKPELDLWEPGEHNGTFRGNNLAFVAAAEALSYWENDRFAKAIARKGEQLRSALLSLADRFGGEVRGRGLMQGIALEPGLAEKVCAAAFERGLVIETSGTDSEVVKVMPPLVIDPEGLDEGLAILRSSMQQVVEAMGAAAIR
ncbi:diaminobutyrate--2-oxoglutarate transaminase [Cohnella zeiphila]|uniref:Diaminobutyrate--2-oxoglutarate transaminase n=1 Tax=Cohnella zeiphila TaxID=2761120 RepID=A0A7X0VVS2_9BACL|nr:diaminobutyrate--2-oxoglutarate transaminase [Cohnella zeiphila]MBB6731740.1 diaminobutyrate--2-oxoglutarate transaminase [Cohnella zeiphila]